MAPATGDSPFQVRRLAAQDLPALLGLYPHLHPADDPLPSDEQVASVWSEILANPRFVYFGGFVGGALVSSCTIAIVPNLTRACRPYGLIENVVTHAEHRQRGYGKAILNAALDHAWSQGCYKVMLMTGRKDEATRQFYLHTGFDGDAKRAFVVAAR